VGWIVIDSVYHKNEALSGFLLGWRTMIVNGQVPREG
jgi:hypothetical protein